MGVEQGRAWKTVRLAKGAADQPRRIAIVNGKGGCGKTTTAVNLAAALVDEGGRSLLVDLDPQGHASRAVGVNPRGCGATLYDLLADDDCPAACALVSVMEGLDLLPGGAPLAALEQCLRSERPEERSARAARVLARLPRQYDFVVFDTPPSTGLLTLMALRAAREVIVPVEMSSFALGAMLDLMDTIEILRKRTEHEVDVRVLPTQYDGRSRFATSMLAELRELAGPRSFDVVIRRNVHLAEAAKRGLPILGFSRTSNGAMDYAALAAEVQASKGNPPRERLRLVVPAPVATVARPAAESPTFVRSFSVVSPSSRDTPRV